MTTRFTVQILNSRNRWIQPDDEGFGSVGAAIAHALRTYGDTYFWRVTYGDEVIYDEIGESASRAVDIKRIAVRRDEDNPNACIVFTRRA